MTLWTMIFGIVALGVIGEMYSARLKFNGKLEKSRGRESDLSRQVDALETRLKNLETIVLEQEKLRDFDKSLT